MPFVQSEKSCLNNSAFSFSLTQKNHLQKIIQITIDQGYIQALYQQGLEAQKSQVQTFGFEKGATPLYYIEQNYRPTIIEHLKELLFTHCAINMLCQVLHKKKLVIIGDPILSKSTLDVLGNIQFSFTLTTSSLDNGDKWQRLSLRAPERKNYKDLDRQVESFIKDETEKANQSLGSKISVGDWVCFDLALANSKQEPLLPDYNDTLWIRLTDEEPDREVKELFYEKSVGDAFAASSNFLQQYVSNRLNANYVFLITIKDHIPHSYFSFDDFKHHFGIKHNKELHQKLIEVFSYRNDLSQRRETIEAAFKLLLKHYFITVPKPLLEKQRQRVLSVVHENPDYHVYKAQNDFKEKIRLLAEKQLKEAIIVDSIAYADNISISQQDVRGYLNLNKRARTKEFIYFDLPSTRVQGQEIPISNEILKQYCLREKTLNHIIHHLTKKYNSQRNEK